MIFHAQPRFTTDINLFIKADLANARATYAALAEFGAPLEGIRPEEFADRGSFFRFGRDPRGFDILPDLPGVDFDAAWERRVEGVLDAATGFTEAAPKVIARPPGVRRPLQHKTITEARKLRCRRPKTAEQVGNLQRVGNPLSPVSQRLPKRRLTIGGRMPSCPTFATGALLRPSPGSSTPPRARTTIPAKSWRPRGARSRSRR